VNPASSHTLLARRRCCACPFIQHRACRVPLTRTQPSDVQLAATPPQPPALAFQPRQLPPRLRVFFAGELPCRALLLFTLTACVARDYEHSHQSGSRRILGDLTPCFRRRNSCQHIAPRRNAPRRTAAARSTFDKKGALAVVALSACALVPQVRVRGLSKLRAHAASVVMLTGLQAHSFAPGAALQLHQAGGHWLRSRILHQVSACASQRTSAAARIGYRHTPNAPAGFATAARATRLHRQWTLGGA
jgi:hypothetical protein